MRFESVLTVKTLPLVAISIFFMSSRRVLKPRPPMQAMTSNPGASSGPPDALNDARCWMRVTLSRAVPSSSVIFASMTTWALNSLGMARLRSRVEAVFAV